MTAERLELEAPDVTDPGLRQADISAAPYVPGVPVAWLDASTPPLGVSLETWARTPWHARAVITRRTAPAPPSVEDPPWRLAALALRDELDARARAGGGHVRHPRRHRRNV